MKPKVTVCLLSRDRPGLITETLDSILAQTYRDFEVVVSDNSEYDEVEALLRARYPAVRRVRRKPNLSAPNHFRTVLNEIEAEYFVLFHDDDVMLAGYLERMVGVLEENLRLAAAGCNAWILREHAGTDKLTMDQREALLLLDGPEALVYRYLSLMTDHAPFPGYLYRTAMVRSLFPDSSEGGKYADVPFLMKVAQRGPIAWLREPLMKYRIHSESDSATLSIGQFLRLLRFIYKNTAFKPRSDVVRQFRLVHWKRWLFQPGRQLARGWRSHRIRTVARFVVSSTLRLLLTKPELWKRIIAKKFS